MPQSSFVKHRFRLIICFLSFLLFALQAPLAQSPPEGGCFIYPCPVRGNSARLVYNLPSSGTLRVYIYNEAGDLTTSDRQWNTTGVHQMNLDLTHYLRGIYLCLLYLDPDSGGRVKLKSFKFIVAK